MIYFIVGEKGTGKTKKLIEYTNRCVETSTGNVVALEKGTHHKYDVTHEARLIDIDEYGIEGYDVLYGFLSGLCAGNYDITDVLVDSVLKICSDNMKDLETFIDKVLALTTKTQIDFYFSLSMDESGIPESVMGKVKKI